jgi:hypothetical protein
MADLPRTTTTGDLRKDFRSKGTGAEDSARDPLHHAEDAHLIRGRGALAQWRSRLARASSRAR